MELNNKDDVDPLVTSSIILENKINTIQEEINKKLRPSLIQLNQEGEPSLAIAQDKSMRSTAIIDTCLSVVTVYVFCFYAFSRRN